MTQQTPDHFKVEGEKYTLLAINGGTLYTAHNFGIVPIATETDNYRGYVMTYDCVNGRFILDKMDVHTDEAPTVNGVEPMTVSMKNLSDGSLYGHFKYENIGLKTKFSGKLFFANYPRFRGITVIRGPPTFFWKVIELEVVDGDIVTQSDLSQKNEERYQLRCSSADDPSDTDSVFDELYHWMYEDLMHFGYTSNDCPDWDSWGFEEMHGRKP